MQKSKIIAALKQTTLFKTLDEKQLQVVAETAKFRQFFPEETIVWQGNPSNSLFLLINGIVAVRKILGQDHVQTLAYLMTGNTFGEIGILENRPRSASVDAVTDVDVLVIQRKDFMNILFDYPQVTISLARILGQKLIESNRRQSRKSDKTKVVLIIDTHEGGGATSMGLIMSQILADKSKIPTVYTEYPNAHQLVADMQLGRNTKTHRHPNGYDIVVSHDDEMKANALTTTSLMLDRLMQNYENIIITVKKSISDTGIDQNTIMMLDYADQLVLLAPPVQEAWGAVERTKTEIRKHIGHDTTVFTIVNHNKVEIEKAHVAEQYDFDVPYCTDFPNLASLAHYNPSVPKSFMDIVETLVDRLDRTNRIAIFIPTTVDVNSNLDTTPYVQKTLDFLAERFGGATSKEASGVWNSSEVGLVGEKVYIVNTFVTPQDLNKYLDEVIDYVKKLKVELRQEAMALEVNNKLTLL